MEQMHEGLILAEPGYPQQEKSIHMPMPSNNGDNAAEIDDPVVKQLIPKINRQHAAAIRMLKGSLRAMARTGEALVAAQANLGASYPHWVQLKLSLTKAEADFLICLSAAESGINEKDLSPAREVKLARLVELLGELVTMWHSQVLTDETFENAKRDSAGEPPPIAEAG